MDHPGTYGDPTPNKPDPDDLHNPGNIPGHAVRQQTADLATLIDLATSSRIIGDNLAPYFMFMAGIKKTLILRGKKGGGKPRVEGRDWLCFFLCFRVAFAVCAHCGVRF